MAGNRKAKDTRPARARYWAEKRLRKRKIANLVRCCGMTPEQASVHWHRVRVHRFKK